MGLEDDITTLETKYLASQSPETGNKLALALAEMIGRKASKRLVWSYFNQLTDVLRELGRYDELIAAADGVDPANSGVWDAQAAVTDWLQEQQRTLA